jgi:hypothetical protein
LPAQGRSLLLSQGYRTKGSWWRPGAFSKLRALIPEWISQELALWQANLMLLDQQIAQLKTELAQSLQGPLLATANPGGSCKNGVRLTLQRPGVQIVVLVVGLWGIPTAVTRERNHRRFPSCTRLKFSLVELRLFLDCECSHEGAGRRDA